MANLTTTETPPPPQPSGEGGLIAMNLSKTFAGTKALDRVSAHFPAGTITALLGQNGSGKSTLIKILAGFYQADPGGQVSVGGQMLPANITPKIAHEAGLRFIHQDLGLVESLTVADNFAFVNGWSTPMLGAIPAKHLQNRVARALEEFSVSVRPTALISELTPTQRTMVAIARAFAAEDTTVARDRVLILDEPTASLPADEVHFVFGALQRARDAGAAVIFVSHRIDEVREIADRLVVLRDGRVTADRDLEGLDVKGIVNLILGREFVRVRAEARSIGEDVVLDGAGLMGRILKGVDVTVRSGEIVGVTGLLGCGRSELTRIVTGAQAPRGGRIRLNGVDVSFASPREAIAVGIGSVPQNRRADGCIPDMNLRENATLGNLKPFWRGGRLMRDAERAEARRIIGDYDIRPPLTEKALSKFSGGNQQKAVVAKWVRLGPKLLVLDEPTQGVDIGAKQEIAGIVARLASDGVAVLVGSSDFEELVNLCDRVIVLNRGHKIAEVPRSDLSESHLTLLSTSGETP